MTGDLNAAIGQVAEKLGTTADRILAILPQYAQMKVAANACGAIVCAIIAVILFVFAVRTVKTQRLLVFEMYDEEASGFAALIMLVIGVFLAILAVVGVFDSVSWALWPDAKVMDAVVKAVTS